MKNLAVALAFAAVTLQPASARMMACKGENFAKMTDRMATMPHGYKRRAIMREMSAVNTNLSNGDMREACEHYLTAQRIQNNEHNPFESLLLE